MPTDPSFLISGVLTAIFIAGTTWIGRWTWKRVREAVAERRTKRSVRAHQGVHSDLVNMFSRHSVAGRLYLARNLYAGEPISILVNDGLLLCPEADPAKFLVIDEPVRRVFEVNAAVVEARQRSGARLWDGDILYLRSTDFVSDEHGLHVAKLHAGVANYFSHVTAAENLRRIVARRDHVALAQAHFGDLERLLRFPPRPLSISGVVVCAFRVEDGWRVPLAVRSHEVINAMGGVSVLPTFGFESNQREYFSSKYDVIHYNFFKEFLEELCGQEEAVHNADSPKMHPDAVFESELGREMILEFQNGDARLEMVGLGGELTDGSVTLALLAKFANPAYFPKLMCQVGPLSWESRFRSAREPLIMLEVRDGRVFPEQLDGLRLTNTSHFALDLALSRLR